MRCLARVRIMAVLAGAAFPAIALAENVGSVEIAKMDVGRYERLATEPESSALHGFVKIMSPPKGQSFLVLWLELKLTPGKDQDGDPFTSVESESIRLIGSKAWPAVGSCTRDGRFSTYSSGFSYYGKPRHATEPFSLVFSVPSGEREFTLRLGDAEHKVAAPAKAETTVDRTAIADFKIDRIEVLDRLTEKQELGSFDEPLGEFVEEVESTVSKYVSVRLLIKPRAANSGSDFSLASHSIGLLYGAQVYVAPIGTSEYGEFSAGQNFYYSERDAAGEFRTLGATLIFPLPGRVTKFRVLYLMQPIADAAVPK